MKRHIPPAPKPRAPRGPLHVDLTEAEWSRAIGLARKGETWLLCELLLDLDAEIPLAARQCIADLVAKSKRRRGLPGRLTANNIEWIRFSAGLERALNPQYRGRRGRALLVNDFAKHYKVAAATMREVMAAKRRRYAAK